MFFLVSACIILYIFSLFELPFITGITFFFSQFKGVSGSLRSLQQIEKDIISEYGIDRLAFAPSIYGDSQVASSPFVLKLFTHIPVERWCRFSSSIV
jgi:hypothetical protein